MIALFFSQTKSVILELERDVKLKNYDLVGSNAHKLKTSFGVIGANLTILDFLENISINKPQETEIYTNLDCLMEQLDKIYQALNK